MVVKLINKNKLSGRIPDSTILSLSGWILYPVHPTRADFMLDQSAHLFTFSLSANHNAGNEKFTTRRARKYCRLLGLP